MPNENGLNSRKTDLTMARESRASGMVEMRVRLNIELYKQLVERAEALRRKPDEIIAEAVEYWLDKQQEDVRDTYARINQLLEQRGFRFWGGKGPADPKALEQKKIQMLSQMIGELNPPLSEDIIRERESSW